MRCDSSFGITSHRTVMVERDNAWKIMELASSDGSALRRAVWLREELRFPGPRSWVRVSWHTIPPCCEVMLPNVLLRVTITAGGQGIFVRRDRPHLVGSVAREAETPWSCKS